jgi:hypothetical protein
MQDGLLPRIAGQVCRKFWKMALMIGIYKEPG